MKHGNLVKELDSTMNTEQSTETRTHLERMVYIMWIEDKDYFNRNIENCC